MTQRGGGDQIAQYIPLVIDVPTKQIKHHHNERHKNLLLYREYSITGILAFAPKKRMREKSNRRGGYIIVFGKYILLQGRYTGPPGAQFL